MGLCDYISYSTHSFGRLFFKSKTTHSSDRIQSICKDAILRIHSSHADLNSVHISKRMALRNWKQFISKFSLAWKCLGFQKHFFFLLCYCQCSSKASFLFARFSANSYCLRRTLKRNYMNESTVNEWKNVGPLFRTLFIHWSHQNAHGSNSLVQIVWWHVHVHGKCAFFYKSQWVQGPYV